MPVSSSLVLTCKSTCTIHNSKHKQCADSRTSSSESGSKSDKPSDQESGPDNEDEEGDKDGGGKPGAGSRLSSVTLSDTPLQQLQALTPCKKFDRSIRKNQKQ